MPYGRRLTHKRAGSSKYRSSTRRSTRSYAPRKRYSRRKNYTKVKSLRPKWLNPLSQKQLVCFNYSDSSFSRTLNVAGGYSGYYVFRGNGPFDPDYTGVGVQPYGYDQYTGSALYTYYRCPSSSIRVYFRAEETYASIRRLHAFLIPMRIPNPVLTDISDVRNIPLRIETTYDGETESTKGAKMKHYCSTRKIFTEGTSTDFGFTSGYATVPSGQWYWIVHFYTDVYDTEEVDIYFDVKIKYYTILSRSDVPNES